MSPNESERLRTDRFRVVDIEASDPDGAPKRRTVIRHPGAVVMLPVLDDGRIRLIENFRPAIDQTLLELPAGTREPGESPEMTARRELQEETGLVAARWERLLEFYVSPGILDERMIAFMASDLSETSAEIQPDEWIQPRTLTLDRALALIDDGRICDAKSITVLLYYHRWLASGSR